MINKRLKTKSNGLTHTHERKKLDVSKGAIILFEEFLDKISPLKIANKLGAILIQLPPRFTVKEFKNTEQFLDTLLLVRME
jgi:uncharacterized protein YecE (DUF72 family)